MVNDANARGGLDNVVLLQVEYRSEAEPALTLPALARTLGHDTLRRVVVGGRAL